MNNRAITLASLLLILMAFRHTPALSMQNAAEDLIYGENKKAHFQNNSKGDISIQAMDLRQLLDLTDVISALSPYQVVFIGENHPRYDQHLNQLAIIRGLYAKHPDLVIGAEFVQKPFQQYLDQYIAGQINTREFLDKIEYYDRWRYDFRLYAPIFEFARENGIPMLALNVPTELIQKVGREGLKGLSADERAQLPATIDRSGAKYRKRLKKVYDNHPKSFGDFESFYEAQLVWDEAMAESAANYLQDHPEAHLIVLAGNGHLAYGVGIPERFSRRLNNISKAVVLNGWEGAPEPELADYLLFSKEKELPKAGFLGVILKQSDGKLEISEFSEKSAAKAAGIKEDDEILSLNGRAVSDIADVKEIMWDKKPGEVMLVRISRDTLLGENEEKEFKVELR